MNASAKLKVLECDKPIIEAFNNRLGRKKKCHKIHLNLMPGPFLGNRKANVILLLLNPGFKIKDRKTHAQSDFRDGLLKAIKKPENHFYLANEFGYTKPEGQKWWKNVFKGVLKKDNKKRHEIDSELMNEYKIVARNIFCIEYFPYHSKNFAHGALRLPSQEYSFYLVRKAIKRGAHIICARGDKYWLGAVPELAGYKKTYYLSNKRKTSISSKTIGKNFLIIKKLLLKKA